MGSQLFRMTRKGSFEPSYPTSNQCKDVNHPEYFYEVVLLFHGDTPLDENEFLIDHNEINRIVQYTSKHGSCEQLQKQLFRAIKRRIGKSMVGYKMTIRPSIEPAPVAFMDYLFVTKNSYLSCL